VRYLITWQVQYLTLGPSAEAGFWLQLRAN
jgi:hypothetical protein